MSSRIVLLSLLLLPGLAAAQAGRFVLAVGDVVVARGAAEIRAGIGTLVESGDTIRVGPNSNAQVRFSDESIVGLRPGTVLRVDEYFYAGSNDGRERTIFSLLKGGFRTVTGAIGRLQNKERYAVRTSTATVGIRGTHYTLVHCDNDCDANAKPTASGGQTSPGGGVANGTYGGVSDGRIGVENATGERLFGANEFFFVADVNTAPQSLIAPPSFLYDRLAGQDRNKGQKGQETSETMAQSGMNAESRPSEVPAPPAPNEFVVTEQRTTTGTSTVVTTVNDTAVFGAWCNPGDLNCSGGAALVPQSVLTIGAGGVVSAFKIPAGCIGPNDNCDGPSGMLGSPAEVGNAKFPDSTQVVFWGRWASGSITDGSTTFSLSATRQAHLMYAPLTPDSVVSARSGSLRMQSLSLGTTPINDQGASPVEGAIPSITIDFTNRTATIAASSLNFPNQNWSFPSGSGAIQFSGGGAFFRITGTGTCSSTGTLCNGTSAAAANGNAAGVFIGPAGDHAGVSLSGSAGKSSFGTVRVYCPTC